MVVKKVPIGYRVFWVLPQETEAVLQNVDEKLMILVEGIEFPAG